MYAKIENNKIKYSVFDNIEDNLVEYSDDINVPFWYNGKVIDVVDGIGFEIMDNENIEYAKDIILKKINEQFKKLKDCKKNIKKINEKIEILNIYKLIKRL